MAFKHVVVTYLEIIKILKIMTVSVIIVVITHKYLKN